MTATMHEALVLFSVLSETGVEHQSGWVDQIHNAMHVLSILIGVVGAAVIVWGVLCGLLRLAKLEVAAFRKENATAKRKELKEHLGFYLLLGLEFLVAADIIETLIAPTVDHLLILGGIIAIRTVISLSLNWELSRKEPQED